MGRRGYQLAASHRLAAEYGLVALFAAAAERFGVLRCALTQISDTLLFPHHHTPERLMRQVEETVRQLYRERNAGIIFDDAYGVWTEADQVSAAAEVFKIFDREEADHGSTETR